MPNDPNTDATEKERTPAKKCPLLEYGPGTLTDTELLATALGWQSEEKIRNIQRLVNSVNLRRLDQIPVGDLEGHGIPRSMVARLVAIGELGRRLWPKSDPDLIRGPEQVYELCRDIRETLREHFVGFYLNSRHEVLSRELISIGSLNASIVHPREVFKPAFALSAASVILAHNHPSGDPTPSEEDLAITRRLDEAGRLLGIHLVDHVVVARDSFTSLRERKLMRS